MQGRGNTLDARDFRHMKMKMKIKVGEVSKSIFLYCSSNLGIHVVQVCQRARLLTLLVLDWVLDMSRESQDEKLCCLVPREAVVLCLKPFFFMDSNFRPL